MTKEGSARPVNLLRDARRRNFSNQQKQMTATTNQAGGTALYLGWGQSSFSAMLGLCALSRREHTGFTREHVPKRRWAAELFLSRQGLITSSCEQSVGEDKKKASSAPVDSHGEQLFSYKLPGMGSKVASPQVRGQ